MHPLGPLPAGQSDFPLAAPPGTWFQEWAERTGHVFFAVELGPPWRFTYLSPAIEGIIGYSASELTSDPALLMGAISERSIADFVAVLPEADAANVSVRRKSGSMAVVHVRARRVVHDDGRTTIEGVAHDVTDEQDALTRAEQSEEWFRLSFEMSDVGLCIVDTDGQFLMVNEALTRMLGRSEGDLVGRTWQEVTHPEDVRMDLSMFSSTVAEGRAGYRLRKRFLRGDGVVMWGDLTTSVYRDDSKLPTLWVSQIVDVTAQVDAEQRLAASEEKYRLLAENSSDVIMHVRDGAIYWASPSLRRSLGWDPAKARGLPILDFIHPDDASTYGDVGAKLFGEESLLVRLRVRAAAGDYHWIAAHVADFRDSDGETAGTAVSFRVIDDDVRREAELDRRARFDNLTGLLNRDALFDGIAEVQRAGQPPHGSSIGVLFIDLDDFKRLNDTHGHAFGDHILRTIADRVQANVRPGDLVARMGGDELLVVLTTSVTRPLTERIGQRLRAVIAKPIVLNGLEERTTASIGGVVGGRHDDPDQLVAQADAAMYLAKASGRDRVVLVD